MPRYQPLKADIQDSEGLVWTRLDPKRVSKRVSEKVQILSPRFSISYDPATSGGGVEDYGLILTVLSSWMASDGVELVHDPERSVPSCG